MTSSKPQFVEERGQKVKLNNLCSRGKSSLRQKDVSNDGPYAVYGASGLVGTMASFQNAVPYVAVVKDGAGVGRASACEANTSVLGTMQALIPSEGIDRDYLLHLVRSLHLGDGFSGSTIPHIYFKDYGKLPVRLHSPAEQKRIVDIFASIERQIKVSKQQLDQLDSLVKSRFIEMFGDPIRNPLRMSVSSVEELAAPIKNSMKAGPFGSALKKEVYAESGYKVYGQEQVISGNQFLGNYYIDKEKYEQLNSCKVMPGDVLISLVGTVGKVLILSEDCQPGIINPRLVKITFDKRKIFPEYFAIAFSLESVRSSLLGRAHGQTMNVLNLGMIKKLKLPVPPISRQKEYLNFVSQVDKSRFGGMLHLLNSLSGIMHASFFSVADTD